MSVRGDHDYVEYVTARLPRLHRAAYLMCGDAHRADDLVQSTLLSLYRHWNQAAAVVNLDAYVHTIMTRRFVDERRHSWTRVVLTDRTPDLPVEPDQRFDERDAVVGALRRLPKGQRAVIVLRFFCDFSVEATAEVLGCSDGNVKSQTSRGLAALRNLLSSPEVPTTARHRGSCNA